MICVTETRAPSSESGSFLLSAVTKFRVPLVWLRRPRGVVLREELQRTPGAFASRFRSTPRHGREHVREWGIWALPSRQLLRLVRLGRAPERRLARGSRNS